MNQGRWITPFAALLTGALFLSACDPLTSKRQPTLPSVHVACRLPIDGLAPESSPAAETGFVSFPARQSRVDPSGALFYDQARSRFTTLTSPSLSGWGGSSYSRALTRWLPVPRKLVAPDGLAYTWTESVAMDPNGTSYGNRIHVVDGRTGFDRALSNPPSQLAALAYTAEGIYAINDVFVAVGYDIRSELWLLDPRTGTASEIRDTGEWQAVVDKVAWGIDIDPKDPNPASNIDIGNFPDRVRRFDIRAGTTEDWFTQWGATVSVVGVDLAGHPLVEVIRRKTPDRSELWLISSANRATLIAHVTGLGPIRPIADQHGIWFAGNGGIFLYTLTTGAQRVAAVGGFPAGPCV
jgi:hypothetical protein